MKGKTKRELGWQKKKNGVRKENDERKREDTQSLDNSSPTSTKLFRFYIKDNLETNIKRIIESEKKTVLIWNHRASLSLLKISIPQLDNREPCKIIQVMNCREQGRWRREKRGYSWHHRVSQGKQGWVEVPKAVILGQK